MKSYLDFEREIKVLEEELKSVSKNKKIIPQKTLTSPNK